MGKNLGAIGVMLALGTPASVPVRERGFSFEYRVVVEHLPQGARKLELWLPVPHDNHYQHITNLKVETPAAHRITEGALGNRMLHLEADPPQAGLAVTVRFEATRREHRAGDAANPAELAHWLQPDRLVPVDDTIREWAREVVTKAHARTDLEKGRAIFNHVVNTMKYDKTGTGWGNGDIYYACRRRQGNCTDFHAMFIGFCRALGIPARFSIGFPLPADRGAGRIAGYHCWAEFYARGVGWVPVDCSEAAKDPSRREYFFGTHDENRIEFSRGRDLVLKPAQEGPPLNYFIYPYVEVDGKKFTDLATSYSYRDLDR